MRSRGCLLLVVLALCASPALAKDEGWRLEDTTQRYELDLEAPPFKLPDSVTIPTTFVVDENSFRNGRTPAFPLVGPGDLVWYYLLALPEGELKNRRTVPVDDAFPVKGGSLIVKGERKLKRRGKKVTITADLKLSTDVKGHPLSQQGADLTVTSVFDIKKGIMREATMQLVAPVVIAGQPGTLRWSGDAKPANQLEVGKKSFHIAVQKAIERGRDWLLKRTLEIHDAHTRGTVKGNYLLGRQAIHCFALLRSGVPAEKLDGVFAWMAKQPLADTYSVSLLIMALEARSVQRESIKPRDKTRSVVRFKRGNVDAKDKQLIKAAAQWLIDTRKDGGWNYYGFKEQPGRVSDRSNSQFAILALHSAVACGVEVPPDVWEDVIKEVLEGQEDQGPTASIAGSEFSTGSPLARAMEDESEDGEDGTRVRPGQGSDTKGKDKARGWAYAIRKAQNLEAYGSMTAAGVSSLAVAREALGGGNTQADSLRGTLQAIRDGLAWLASKFDVEGNPGGKGEHYYYWLYSLEKAMDTAGVERLAKHEWWREAAAALLPKQSEAGNWGEDYDTALALLVLNRATLPAQLEIEAVSREATGGKAAWDRVAVEDVGRLGVRQLLDAMAERPQVAAKRLKLAKKAVPLVDDEQRPRLISRLLKLMESSHKPTKRWATKVCKGMAGTTKPKELEAFADAHKLIRRAGESRDTSAIAKVRDVLGADDPPPALLRLALVVAARLRAVEALPDVVEHLKASKPDDRQVAWDCLTSLAGGEPHPFEPKASARVRNEQIEAWRGWVSEQRDELVAEERLRRALADLGRGGERADAAEQALRERGEAAWPHLADALLDDSTRKRAHELLKDMTEADLPPDADAWRRWIGGDRDVEPVAAAPEPKDPEATDTPAKPTGPKSAPGRERWELVPRPSQGAK